MKRMLSILLGLALGALVGAAAPDGGELAQKFAAPPESAKPWVYWFWSDGNLTREGITADLEAMKRTGIGGVLIMEVDQGPPKGPARFMGAQWRELFKFMLSEAKRLGIEVNMNNDAGWCGSGGPWITPENAQKKMVWTETYVQGPKHLEISLKQPETVRDWYQDIAVLAFPSPAGDGAGMAEAKPKVTTNYGKPVDAAKLFDGDPATRVELPKPRRVTPQYLQFEFAKPYAARRLALTIPMAARQGYSGWLQTSTNGEQWKTIANISQRDGGAVNFPRTESKFYRVVFTGVTGTLDKIRAAEVALTPGYRIGNFLAKSGMSAQVAIDPDIPAVEPAAAVAPEKIVDLTAKMDAQGKLAWDAPEGRWTVIRFGFTPTGKDNHPAPEEGRGLECDKLSKKGITAQFDGLVAKLLQDSGPGTNKVMTTVHIDSWEVGCQNWTTAMREEFKKRRGYDPFPYLPAMTGRVVGSTEVSERFLWDMRRTISEMLNDYYAEGLRELAHQNGMKLSIEAYSGGPFDNLSYSGRADIPIGEFWTGQKIHGSLKPMSSGGHIYGNQLVAAEAFTASNTAGRQKNHPGSIKALGDEAFCNGINRFIFHRYSMQPWVSPVRAPGMTMGPWGLEYERTATWWEKSTAWHQYLARCQYLLQQGIFQADLCYLENEEGFTPLKTREAMVPAVPEGYDYDACPPEVILTRASVEDGRLALQGGMRYRMLVLPTEPVMTPALLGKIKELVMAGATVYGAPPRKSPSLVNYPKCDDEVRSLVAELWGDADGKTPGEHACGKGKVIWGKPLEEALAGMGAAPDFDYQTKDPAPAFHSIHRSVEGNEVYFVANGSPRPVEAVCSFRVEGRRPELWRPDTGTIEPVAVYQAEGGRVRVPIHFDPSGSVFVVFRKDAAAEPGRVIAVASAGKNVIDTAWDKAAQKAAVGAKDNNVYVIGSFTMAAWVKPEGTIQLPREKNSGSEGTRYQRNDVVYPAPGHEVYAKPGQLYATEHACAGLSVGTNGVVVYEHGDSLFAPVLVLATPITERTHVAVAYNNGIPSLYLNGKLARQGLKTGRTVHPALGVKHSRGVSMFNGECTALRQADRELAAEEIAALMRETASITEPKPQEPMVAVAREAAGALTVRAARGGSYTLKTAEGRELKVEAPAPPAPLAIEGPWEVSFPPNWGAPAKATFAKLISWPDSTDPGIKYFSGTATYRKAINIPAEMIGKGRSLDLDLGDVQVIAQVKLNGKDLGILWKAPYRVEITEAAMAGENTLEVEVVNLWVNRLIGDEQLPEDCTWKDMGARGWVLAEYPKWLLEGKPSPSGRFTFKTWKHYTKDSPLLPSGLIGPVRLVAEDRAALPKE